jgi:hypothetical protein
MFTGFEMAQNFVVSRLFSRESCVKTDKINTIQQSGVGQLRSYALRQVSSDHVTQSRTYKYCQVFGVFRTIRFP